MGMPSAGFMWTLVNCSDGKILLCFGDGAIELSVTVLPHQARELASELLQVALEHERPLPEATD